ncbi:hypothetical protein PIROE2DRAFT_2841 [Piromyces sp. E2]|nr:hypothetical protein PIROE2DRAFT_2841 [Piromyces sp. E2]|eukprot:OUM69333.1 hypothetical protein PIROE2DRAFT_2841 [Piromyces sp. E2]
MAIGQQQSLLDRFKLDNIKNINTDITIKQTSKASATMEIIILYLKIFMYNNDFSMSYLID